MQHPLRRYFGVFALLTLGLSLVGCQVQGLGTQPVVKIGLVAPFEGRYREIGYDVIFAARLAVQEANRAGGVNGYSIELIAMDDRGDAQRAIAQASKLAGDPQVIAVVGHFLPETTAAAEPIYTAAGIPMLATTDLTASELATVFQMVPTQTQLEAAAETFANTANLSDWYYCDCPITAASAEVAERPTDIAIGPPQWGFNEFRKFFGEDGVYFVSPVPRPAELAEGQAFYERYTEISYGTQPAAFAVLTYDTLNTFFAAMMSIEDQDTINRTTTVDALAAQTYSGLSGQISFENGVWADPPITVYQWAEGAIVAP